VTIHDDPTAQAVDAVSATARRLLADARARVLGVLGPAVPTPSYLAALAEEVDRGPVGGRRPGAPCPTRPHDQRLGGAPRRVVVHALEQLAVGDAGGGEEAVVAGDEVVGG
jgi:hypothetical protein